MDALPHVLRTMGRLGSEETVVCHGLAFFRNMAVLRANAVSGFSEKNAVERLE